MEKTDWRLWQCYFRFFLLFELLAIGEDFTKLSCEMLATLLSADVAEIMAAKTVFS